MSKIPIYITGLALAAMPLTSLIIHPLDGLSQANTRYELLNDTLTGEDLSLLNEITYSDINNLEENVNDSYFRFLAAEIAKNRMSIEIFQNGDWQIRRIVIAYRNYENGVSETMADENLVTLGVKNDGEWVMLRDYDARGASDLSIDMSPYYNGKTVQLTANLTDIIYYAVEYGHKVDGEWQDQWWMRGKINYRSCAHHSQFDPKKMVCSWDGSNYIAKMSDYTTVNLPDEDVMSWDEEWAAIQQERYTKTSSSLTALEENLYNVTNILNSAEGALKKLALTLPTADGLDDKDELITSLPRWEQLAKDLRSYYERLQNLEALEDANNLRWEKEELEMQVAALESEKINLEERIIALEVENGSLQNQFASLQEEKVSVEAENEALKQERASVEAENEALKQERASIEVENEILKQENAQLKSDSEKVTDKAETQIAVIEKEPSVIESMAERRAVKEETIAEKKTAEDNKETGTTTEKEAAVEETVALPNLGGAESKSEDGVQNGAKALPEWLPIIASIIGVCGLVAGIITVRLGRKNSH